tara:strand:+ start:131 stop:769 length:639 start_codon:yes stop_codon:yes gene_type:complete
MLKLSKKKLMMKEHLDRISNLILETGEFLEGNIYCDIKPDNIIKRFEPKQKNIIYFSKNKKRICEIGFNAGHSALFMLESNPKAEYTFFDLKNHGYAAPCYEYLNEAFEDTKMNIIYGDSKETLKDYVNDADYKNKLNSYDFIHIDGGHDIETLKSDYAWAFLLSKSGGHIIIDDTDVPHINKFVSDVIAANQVEEVCPRHLTNLHRILIKK